MTGVAPAGLDGATGAAPPPGNAEIKASALEVKFGEFVALRDVNFDIAPGRFVCFVGPSGCGKSTCLNAIAGLVKPSSGSIEYRGRVVKGVNTDCGYITQNDTLLPWATVQKNVALGLRIRKYSRAEERERVEAILRRVGLWEFRDRYPAQLSGGMRKRAQLARTMVYSPETLLLDEPFAALDAQMRYQLQVDLLELWERERKTVVFVTHDLDEALLLADEIVIFGTRPGRVVHRESVDIPRPRDALQLRQDPEFWSLWRRLWHYIEGFERTGVDPGVHDAG